MSSNLNIGVANGIQALLPIQAPVNLCGNAIGLLGSANSYCVGGANADYASPVNNPVYNPYLYAQGGYGQNLPIPLYPILPGGGGGGDTDLQSALNGGITNGIQADAKIQAPINLCGNAIGILGSANSFCNDGADANLFSNSGAAQTLPYILPPARNTTRAPHKTVKPTAAKPAAKPTAAKPGAKPTVKLTGVKPTAVESSPTKRGVAAKPGKKTEGGLLANLLPSPACSPAAVSAAALGASAAATSTCRHSATSASRTASRPTRRSRPPSTSPATPSACSAARAASAPAELRPTTAADPS